MIRKLIFILTMGCTLASCTKDFSTVNSVQTSPASTPIAYQFSNIELLFAGSAGDPGYTQWRGNLMFPMPIVQMLAAVGSTGNYAGGDKYIPTNPNIGGYFGTSDGEGNYSTTIKNTVNVLSQARADSVNGVNVYAMTRILRVLEFQTMTDLYGDVPYFDAGNAYLTGNLAPAFDKQQLIYMDMLNELAVAGAALDASKSTIGAADFAYQGDVTKWKHFANSLMLRIAMHMVNADPANAQVWAKKALDGGVMTSNAETFAMAFDGASNPGINPISYDLGPSDGLHRGETSLNNVQWAATFINILKARNDPRLSQIATVGSIKDATGNFMDPGNTDPAVQKGLPNGLNTAPDPIGTYSMPNILTYKSTSPQMFLTYAETEFLKAEAIERGWYTGSAAAEYALGQTAALQQMTSYSSTFALDAGTMTAYMTANAFPNGGLAADLNAIITEKYILFACTYNGFEAWTDYRRTSLPALTPTNYPGNVTNGTIPRRLQYPNEEQTLDPAGYAEAIANQGQDLMTTRVWWDKAGAAD